MKIYDVDTDAFRAMWEEDARTLEPRWEAYQLPLQLLAMLKSPGAMRGHEDVIEATHASVCAILRARFA